MYSLVVGSSESSSFFSLSVVNSELLSVSRCLHEKMSTLSPRSKRMVNSWRSNGYKAYLIVGTMRMAHVKLRTCCAQLTHCDEPSPGPSPIQGAAAPSVNAKVAAEISFLISPGATLDASAR